MRRTLLATALLMVNIPAAHAAESAPQQPVYILVQVPPGTQLTPGKPLVLSDAPPTPMIPPPTAPAPAPMIPAPTVIDQAGPALVFPQTDGDVAVPGQGGYASKHEQAKAAWRAKVAQHRREPDGCPTPIGCGNFWTEWKFVLGSCRQFYGTADASEGCWNKTIVPPPKRYRD